MKTRNKLLKHDNSRAGSCLRVGKILNVIFPKGIFIGGEQKFSEIGLLVAIIEKILAAANLRFREKEKAMPARDTLENVGVNSLVWADLIKHNAKKPSKKKSRRKLKELYRRKIDR